MSPTVLRVKGYRFYFFSREEARAHVYVQHATGEARLWLEPEIGAAQNWGLSRQRLNTGCALHGSTPMKSAEPGRRTLAPEVTNISPHGFWILIDGREVFVSFNHFPWFADASVQQIGAVQRPSPHHLRWAELDVDLAVESLDDPEKYPMVSRVRSNKRLQLSRARQPSKKAGRRRSRPRN